MHTITKNDKQHLWSPESGVPGAGRSAGTTISGSGLSNSSK